MRIRIGVLGLVFFGLLTGCSGESAERASVPTGTASTRPPTQEAESESLSPLPSARPGPEYSSTSAMVANYEVLDGARTVRIFVAVPDPKAKVCGKQVTETADEIRVAIELCVEKGSGEPEISIGMGGLAYLDIRLDAPVGSRKLLDASGRPLFPLFRPTGSPPATVGPHG